MRSKPHTNCKPLAAVFGVVAGAGALLLLPSCASNKSYDLADSNDDGSVSPAEFDRYMLEAIYTEADANADKKVTFEEWKAANPGAAER